MSAVTDWRVYERRAIYLNTLWERLNDDNERRLLRGLHCRHAAAIGVITRELSKCFSAWYELTRRVSA